MNFAFAPSSESTLRDFGAFCQANFQCLILLLQIFHMRERERESASMEEPHPIPAQSAKVFCINHSCKQHYCERKRGRDDFALAPSPYPRSPLDQVPFFFFFFQDLHKRYDLKKNQYSLSTRNQEITENLQKLGGLVIYTLVYWKVDKKGDRNYYR